MRMNSLVVMVGIKDANNNVLLLGTGFALPKKGYFVTCRHVLGDRTDHIVLVLADRYDSDGYQDASKHKCRMIDVKAVDSVNPLCDLIILKTDSVTLDIPSLGDLDAIQVGDEVDIVGFPHCVNDWQMHILTVQRTRVGAKVLRESQTIKYKYAILNVQTRPGQSGSLVYSPRLQKVIGILVGGYSISSGISLGGINPFELNQTSFCLSAQYINEMLAE